MRVHRSSSSERWRRGSGRERVHGRGAPREAAVRRGGRRRRDGARAAAGILHHSHRSGRRRGEGRRAAPDVGSATGLDALRSMVAGASTQSAWVGEAEEDRDPLSGPLGRCLEGTGRVLLFSDFLDVDPRWVLPRRRSSARSPGSGLRRRGVGSERGRGGGWWFADPERPGSRWSADGAGSSRYLARLEEFVEGWARLARDHRMSHAVWTSGEAFEDHLPGLLR